MEFTGYRCLPLGGGYSLSQLWQSVLRPLGGGAGGGPSCGWRCSAVSSSFVCLFVCGFFLKFKAGAPLFVCVCVSELILYCCCVVSPCVHLCLR